MNIQNRKNKRSNRSTNSKNTEFYIVYTVAFLLIAFFLLYGAMTECRSI